MVGIGLPGPVEWIVILLIFVVGFVLVRLMMRSGRPPEPRGFDVEPTRRDREP